MSKNKRKVIITILACLFLASITVFAACAGGRKEPTLKFVTPNVTYRVGDSINCYNLIETEADATYSFTVKTENDESAVSVVGQTFYANIAGDYTVSCTAKLGEKSKSDQTVITVKEALPVAHNTALFSDDYDCGELLLLKDIGTKTVKAYSDTAVTYDVTKLTLFKNKYIYQYYTEGNAITEDMQSDIVEYSLTGDPSADEVFVIDEKLGKYISLKYEGYYVFDVLISNAGGTVEITAVFEVIEDFSQYHDYDKEVNNSEIEYDFYADNNDYASWNVYPDAVSYKVKVDFETVITDQTNSYVSNGKVYFNIKKYLSAKYTAFQNFDLHVVPLNAEGKPFVKFKKSVKFTLENVSTTPETQKYAVFSAGTKVETQGSGENLIAMAKLSGIMTSGFSYNNFSQTPNNYVAWNKDYETGYYVDFTFSGNNLPNVMFYADSLDGKMTSSEGNAQGVLILSGAYGKATVRETLYADSVLIIGPHRIDGGSSATATLNGEFVMDGYRKELKGGKFEKLTQNFLSKDRSETVYKYTVGTFEQGGYIYIDIRLYDLTNSKSLINEHVATNIHITQVTAGKIVAFAPIKQENGVIANSEFTFTTPYKTTPITMANNTESFATSGAVAFSGNESEGEVTLAGNGLDGISGNAYLSLLENIDASYIAWKGNYGVGKFVEFEFTGNNMPNVMFFADKVNGSLVGYTANTKPRGENGATTATKVVDNVNKGLLLFNGVHCAGPTEREKTFKGGLDTFRIWGMNRINPTAINVSYTDAVGALFEYKSGNGDLNAFCQGGKGVVSKNDATEVVKNGLAIDFKNTTFRYVVGTYLKTVGAEERVFVKATLYDKSNNQVVAQVDTDTGYSESEVGTGSIIAYSTLKGANKYLDLTNINSTFKFKAPYTPQV